MLWHLKHIRMITVMYVSSADLLLIQNLARWVVTHRFPKNHRAVKIKWWVLAWGLALNQDNTVHE